MTDLFCHPRPRADARRAAPWRRAPRSGGFWVMVSSAALSLGLVAAPPALEAQSPSPTSTPTPEHAPRQRAFWAADNDPWQTPAPGRFPLSAAWASARPEGDGTSDIETSPSDLPDDEEPASPSDRAGQSPPLAASIGEEETAEGDPAGDEGETANPDDLDNLLNLAEKDVSQLARVNVAAAVTTAPSLNMEVSTVSRQTSTVGRSPAAVFVITNEMIRRSGARSIPDALRLAPGVHVARIDANKYAISIRGFTSRFSNKLLVQIDGRTVYTPLFGGVFWEVQNVLLEDVERIEVIRGPGATVWGANAVNGIINVITKKAGETRGVFVEAGGGNEERGFASARHGGQLGENGAYRVYGQWFERDAGFLPDAQVHDDWRMKQGGFRYDWTPNAVDEVTVQGDYHEGSAGQQSVFPSLAPPTFRAPVVEDQNLSGGNLLTRWTRHLDETTEWSLQLYLDHTEREFATSGLREYRNTFDVDFQHRFALADRHALIWGWKYRHTHNAFGDLPFVAELRPETRGDDLFNCFVQDEMTVLEDTLFFTLGSKFEHNDYTGFEFQPTARLLYTPDERHSLWASISRAVRTPTRGEEDLRLVLPPAATAPVPVFPRVLGNRDLRSEVLWAYEAGMRAQPTEWFSWDFTVFYNDYEHLVGVGAPTPVFGFPTYFDTRLENLEGAHSYGAELFGALQVTSQWKLAGSYSWLRWHMAPALGLASPANQCSLWSSWDITDRWQLDCVWRYVDALQPTGAPSYHAFDVRLGWRPTDRLEAAVVARHLFRGAHQEFGDDPVLATQATQVESEVYGSMTWRY